MLLFENRKFIVKTRQLFLIFVAKPKESLWIRRKPLDPKKASHKQIIALDSTVLLGYSLLYIRK